MTPKDKAKELFNKMYMVEDPMGNYPMCFDTAKQCALILVDEIINALDIYDTLTESNLKQEFGLDYFSCELQNMDNDFRYWQQVKHEIEKL
jgi:hypothetical protein